MTVDPFSGERVSPYELLARTCRMKGWRLALYTARRKHATLEPYTELDTLAIYDRPVLGGDADLLARAPVQHVSELDAIAELLLEALVRQGHLKLEVS